MLRSQKAQLPERGARVDDLHGPWMLPIRHQRLADRRGSLRPQQTEPQVPIGDDAQTLVEPAGRSDGFRTHEHARGRPYRADAVEVRTQRLRLVSWNRADHAAVTFDHGEAANAERRGLLMTFRQLTLELVRRPEVVIIEKRKPLCARDVDASVAGTSDTFGPVNPQDAQSGIRPGFKGVRSTVVGSVIDHHHLDGNVNLLERAHDGLHHHAATVSRRDDYGDFGCRCQVIASI
jgi:hypothetical protein